MTEDTSCLGDYVRRRRQELGLTQFELSLRFNPPIQQTDNSAIERGRVKLPPLPRIRQLAAVPETTPGELLEQAGYTGSAGRPTFDNPGGLADDSANSRWRQELVEILPRLKGSEIRALTTMAKRMLGEAEETATIDRSKQERNTGASFSGPELTVRALAHTARCTTRAASAARKRKQKAPGAHSINARNIGICRASNVLLSVFRQAQKNRKRCSLPVFTFRVVSRYLLVSREGLEPSTN